MNFKDLEGAIEDMLNHHGAHFDDTIYIQLPNGNFVPIDGFFFTEDGKVYIK
jgi:hypothetical protein